MEHRPDYLRKSQAEREREVAERQGEMEKLAAGIQVVERPETRNVPEQGEKAAEKKDSEKKDSEKKTAEKKGADKEAETGEGALR